MSIYSIYRVTNKITNKVYIGFTKNDLKIRKKAHKAKANNGTKSKFYNAIRKYGWDNFEWEIIYQSNESVNINKSHTLTIMENYFITEYNSICDGYNSTIGGGKFPVMKGKDHPLYNIGHSTEARNKISKHHADVSGNNNPRARRVRITTPNGEVHEIFGKLKLFCKEHMISYCCVNLTLNGNRIISTLSNWKFEYINEK